MQIFTATEVKSEISQLTKLVDEAQTDQVLVSIFCFDAIGVHFNNFPIQLKKVHSDVADIIRFCRNHVMDAQIIGKSYGRHFVSNINHTKPIAKIRKEKEDRGGGSVYPRRDNLSPIGRPQQSITVSKVLQQKHPGKATSKTVLHFCKWCGIMVGSKLVYTFYKSSKSNTLSDLQQHEIKTTKHSANVKRAIEFVNCKDCNAIHPVGPCKPAGDEQ